MNLILHLARTKSETKKTECKGPVTVTVLVTCKKWKGERKKKERERKEKGRNKESEGSAENFSINRIYTYIYIRLIEHFRHF